MIKLRYLLLVLLAPLASATNVYYQFTPGGALSGTWQSQILHLDAGGLLVLGITPVANGGTGVATLTGIAKGNGTSAFTAAASSDLVALWSGTCNSTTFLRGDGACVTPGGGGGGGTVTSAGVTSTDLSVSGSPITAAGNVTLNINAGAVTLAKQANLAANSMIGNNTGSAATPLALTAAQIKALLAIASSDVSGLSASATTDTTNASNISSGALPAGRMPALTGDCTTSAGAVATNCTKTGGVAFATSATTDATNASNIASGTVSCARLPALTGAVTSPAGSCATNAGAPSQSAHATNYTTVLADANSTLYHNSTSAHTFTIDSNANVAYPVNTTLVFINENSGGLLTIAINSDTLYLSPAGSTGSRTLSALGVATAIKIDATHWLISGAGLT